MYVSDNGGYWRYEGWGEPAAINGIVHYVYTQHGTGSDPGDVYYIRSTDRGQTFSTPLKLNTDSTTRPNWQPNLSVSPSGTLFAVWYDARESTSCTLGDSAVPCYRMWARKSTDNGVTWLPDDMFSDVVSPLPGQIEPGIIPDVGDYDYGSAIAGKHSLHGRDGRVAIAGVSQQDTFTDKELVGFAVTTTDPACNSVIKDAADGLCNQPERSGGSHHRPSHRFHRERNPGGLVYVTERQRTNHVPLQQLAGSTQGVQTMISPRTHLTAFRTTWANFEFNCTFCYAVMPLQVTTTNPPDGGTFSPPAPGDYEYDVNFNQAIDPAAVDISDLTLTGNVGGSVTAVRSMEALPVHRALQFRRQRDGEHWGRIDHCYRMNGNAAFTGKYTVGGCPPQNHYDIQQIGGSIVPGTTDTGNHTTTARPPSRCHSLIRYTTRPTLSANVDSNGTLQFVNPS